ncbi:MAG TPA: hypothetical protein VFM96_02945 [Gaiellaceae bacterium]|nr:hypothetical protein [Gaiellaceae bacterium]
MTKALTVADLHALPAVTHLEHVATWCMSGIADSIQVRRRWFQPSAYAGIAVMLGFSVAVRLEKPLPAKLPRRLPSGFSSLSDL